MCFDTDSLPPIPAIAGAAVSHDDLVLEASDGNRFAAFAATPDEPSGAGIAILPDVRGLYRFYEELALRFAERGHAAIAFDYFGRTAARRSGATTSNTCRTSSRRPRRASRPTSLRSSARSATAARPSSSRSASASAAGTVARRGVRPRPRRGDRLLRAPGPRPRRVGRTGGARRGAAGADPGADGRRGRGDSGHGRPGVRAGPRAGRVEHEIAVYEGAPHSFFDRKFEQFAADSEDAWRRVLGFVERHSAPKR